MPDQKTGKSNAGCYHCTKRRIKCDRATPQCQKCLHKGLTCPGYGTRYRFNRGVAARGKLAGVSFGSEDVSTTSSPSATEVPRRLVWPSELEVTSSDDPDTTRPDEVRVKAAPELLHSSDDALSQCGMSDDTFLLHNAGKRVDEDYDDWQHAGNDHAVIIHPQRDPSYHQKGPGIVIAPVSQDLNSRSRELFAYFSDHIASNMVVFDGKFNGYRNILLPLAATDNLVRAAVEVTSMYHLSTFDASMRNQAEATFATIVKKLRLGALSDSRPNSVLNTSVWATILILLTAETVSGGTNLPYLFKMLECVASTNASADQGSVLRSFLVEQTNMMTLFAQPLLGETSNSLAIAHQPQRYFDFLSTASTFYPANSEKVDVFKRAIHQACQVFLLGRCSGPGSHFAGPQLDCSSALDSLQHTCMQIEPDAQGSHTLVWVYFIGAAESRTPTQRAFFVQRLKSVFGRTRFNNIPKALAFLEYAWSQEGSMASWVDMMPDVMPIFVI